MWFIEVITCSLTSNIQYHLIRPIARGSSRTPKISLLASHDYYPGRHVELQVMPGIKRKTCCAREQKTVPVQCKE